MLAPLPLDEWRATKDTLHLYAQVVGKIRLAHTPPLNHWWHARFWAGDDGTPFPAFSTSTAPEPAGLTAEPLRPSSAGWIPLPNGSRAQLAYDDVRSAVDPRDALLEFLQSSGAAGARAAGWDMTELATSWAPGMARAAATTTGSTDG